MRRPCRTQLHFFQSIRSEVADAHVADKLAVHVVARGPAAAAIAVVVAVVRGGDGGADNRGADEAGSNAPAPAERLGLSLRGGGRQRAGNGKRGEGESGDFGLDRHGKLHPFAGGTVVVRIPLGRSQFERGSNRAWESGTVGN